MSRLRGGGGAVEEALWGAWRTCHVAGHGT